MEQQKIKMSPFLLGAITDALRRLPSAPYDLTKVKKLINFYPVSFWADEIPDMVEEGEGDFSCIGRMPNLHTLNFSNHMGTKFFIKDFSFLLSCKRIRTLNIRNTNFSDCGLLLDMPCLSNVSLPKKENMIHTEAIDMLMERGVQVLLEETEPFDEQPMDEKTDEESLSKIKQALYKAVKSVLTDLYKNKEHYYYITLVSDSGANTPCISAWSYEALASCAENDADRERIKWSYADSPYCCHRQKDFEKVDRLLWERPDILAMEDGQFEAEYEKRYMAMEEAMRRLDEEGLFAVNQAREEVVVLVETMPPEEENTIRAWRMNDSSSQIFRQWLEEAAE